MEYENIAIVGLEHQGELLLEWLISQGKQGPNLVCAVAMKGGAGRHRAEARGVALVDLASLVRLSDGIDIIFDLTSDAELQEHLHLSLARGGNHQTRLLSGDATEIIRFLQGRKQQTVA